MRSDTCSRGGRTASPAWNRPGIVQPLRPDLAMRYGLYDARGYDYPVERRYDGFWRATAGPPATSIPPTARAEPTAGVAARR